MSRGESYGGGQSSLGYLFRSEEEPRQSPPSNTPPLPPYAVDMPSESDHFNSPSTNQTQNHHLSNTVQSHPRPQPQHLGNFLTDRPSTKVKSVPGGDSSLGYLFGDKS